MGHAIQNLLGVGKKANFLFSTRTFDDERGEYRITVYWGGQPFTSYLEESERPLRNNAIGVLAKGGIRQVDLARVFGLKPPQVSRYVKAFEASDRQATYHARPGRPGNIDERMVDFVRKRYREIRAEGKSRWRREVAKEVSKRFGNVVCDTLLSKIVKPILGETERSVVEEVESAQEVTAETSCPPETEPLPQPELFDDLENGHSHRALPEASALRPDEGGVVDEAKLQSGLTAGQCTPNDSGMPKTETVETGQGTEECEDFDGAVNEDGPLEEAQSLTPPINVGGVMTRSSSVEDSSESGDTQERSSERKDRGPMVSESGGDKESDVAEPIVRLGYTSPLSSEAELVSRLEKGFHSRYAGGLLLNPFLARMLSGVLDGERTVKNNTRYGFESFLVLFVQMAQFGFVNLESMRSIQVAEFGVLAQTDRLPGVNNFCDLVGDLLETVDLQDLGVRLARNYLHHLSLGNDVFYIDGQFQTYTGGAKILRDHNNRTKRIQKGNHHYVLGDGGGNPLLLLLSDSMLRLNEVLPVMVGQLSPLLPDGVKSRLAFDRGVNERDLLARLPGELGMDYLTWEVGDDTDYRSMELDYERVQVQTQGNTPYRPNHRTFDVADAPRELPVGIWSEGSPLHDHRRLILREEAIRDGQPVIYCYPFITSDRHRAKTELVGPLVYRWREEVGFKMLGQDYGFNEITTYGTVQYSPDIITEFPEALQQHILEKESRNPDRRRCLDKRREVNRRLLEVEARLAEVTGRRPSRGSPVRSNLPRDQEKLCGLKRQYEGELASLDRQLEELPTRVNRFERCCEKGTVRWDFQKKTFLDLLRMAAHNVRRMGLDRWMGLYTNWRDHTERFRDLLNAGGRLKLEGNRLVVELTPLPVPRYQRAAEAFVKLVHQARPRTFSVNKLPIRFGFRS